MSSFSFKTFRQVVVGNHCFTFLPRQHAAALHQSDVPCIDTLCPLVANGPSSKHPRCPIPCLSAWLRVDIDTPPLHLHGLACNRAGAGQAASQRQPQGHPPKRLHAETQPFRDSIGGGSLDHTPMVELESEGEDEPAAGQLPTAVASAAQRKALAAIHARGVSS